VELHLLSGLSPIWIPQDPISGFIHIDDVVSLTRVIGRKERGVEILIREQRRHQTTNGVFS